MLSPLQCLRFALFQKFRTDFVFFHTFTIFPFTAIQITSSEVHIIGSAVTLAELYDFVLTSFIKFYKALTKFSEVFTKS